MDRVDLKHLAPGMNEELVIEHDADVRWTGLIRAGREHGVRSDRLCGESPIKNKENKQTEDSFQSFYLDSCNLHFLVYT